MQVHPLLRVAIGATLSMALTLAAVAVSAQTWEYKSYKKKGLGGNFDPNQFVIGTVTLEEKDGKATLAMNAGTMDACRRGEMPAAVTRTDAEITIEPEISLAGCEKWRLVIRNDGSGGHRETWHADHWVLDKWDHGLALKK